MKAWLDKHVVPLLHAQSEATQPLRIHSEIHSPPTEFDIIIVYILAEKDTWPRHIVRLLGKEDIYWDYMREFQKAEVHGETRIIFGGDGAPFIHDNGMVSCRLFTKVDDVDVILEVGCHHAAKLQAQADVKELYRIFEEEQKMNFHDVMIKNTPPFGQQ